MAEFMRRHSFKTPPAQAAQNADGVNIRIVRHRVSAGSAKDRGATLSIAGRFEQTFQRELIHDVEGDVRDGESQKTPVQPIQLLARLQADFLGLLVLLNRFLRVAWAKK